MNNSTSNNGKATTTKKTFSRTTSISEIINADPDVIWKILTDASGFANWNSTIISLEGNIEAGGKIKLKSTLDPSRTFKLKVKEFAPNQKLIWGDAMGERVFSLKKNDGSTIFSMTEKIGGPIFPLFASKIPSFDESFEAFTGDLKKKAEAEAK